MLNFKSIKAKNFLCFENLDVDLQDKGLTLVEGKYLASQRQDSNGAGKSSIFESILFTLYGKTARGIFQVIL